jgi:PAS domain S-box-containing protein
VRTSEYPAAEGGIADIRLVTYIRLPRGIRLSDSSEFELVADALSRSEERFRTLVETIPAGVFLYQEGRTLYVNRAAELISGYTRDELLELSNFWQLVHPDSRPRLMEMYEAHMGGEAIPTEHEVQILTKGGESRWVLFRFGWVTSGPERGVLLGTAVDITERKVAADALRKKSDQLQATFNAFPGVLVRLDRRGTILEYAASPGRLLYRWPEEFLGKRVSDVLPRNAASLVQKAIAAVAESGAPATIEFGLLFPDGEQWFETQLVPFEEDQVLVLARDVTRRKEAEEALRESEARYRALYRDNPSMYFTVAADGTVLSVNDYGARQLGYSPEELEGKSVLNVFHPQDKRAVKQQLADCLANPGMTAVWQFRKVRKDGAVIWVEERVRATCDDAGGNPIVLVVCDDITERREMEDNLRESEARLLAFAHAVPDVSFILDEDGLYVEILGRPEKSDLLYSQAMELKGKRLHDVLPRESADAFLTAIRETIQTQEPQVLEYELDVPAGRRCFEGRTAPLPLKGQKSMVVWLALDITARKGAERALVELREELDRKAERSVSQGTDHGLTFRELTVLQLVVAGKSDKEIGETLGISPLTANKHVGNILRKLKVRSRTSATVIALRDGLVS